MHPDLKYQLDKFDLQKTAVIHDLQTWQESQLKLHPRPSDWCALDVISHLVKIERAFINTVQSNLARPQPVTLRDRLGALMVNATMRSPVKVSVPPSAALILPAPATNLADVLKSWCDAREAIRSLLEPVKLEQLKGGVFYHPIGGWMPLPTAIDFLSAHVRHHEYQLRRLKKAKPNSSRS